LGGTEIIHSGQTHEIIPLFKSPKTFTLQTDPLAVGNTHRNKWKREFRRLKQGLKAYKKENLSYRIPEVMAVSGWKDEGNED